MPATAKAVEREGHFQSTKTLPRPAVPIQFIAVILARACTSARSSAQPGPGLIDLAPEFCASDVRWLIPEGFFSMRRAAHHFAPRGMG